MTPKVMGFKYKNYYISLRISPQSLQRNIESSDLPKHWPNSTLLSKEKTMKSTQISLMWSGTTNAWQPIKMEKSDTSVWEAMVRVKSVSVSS